jgi:hypothetical protein
MINWCQQLLLLVLQLYILKSLSDADVQCIDPDAGGTTQNKDRKFLLYSPTSHGSGIGNLLIFFPAAYYFAAITGRYIILEENSIVGKNFFSTRCRDDQ